MLTMLGWSSSTASAGKQDVLRHARHAESAPIGKVLHLGGVSFDPLVDLQPFPSHLAKSASDQADLRLVQSHGPLRDSHRAALEDRGLVLVQYIHPDTYIVWADPAQLESVASLPAVRWTGDFAPACRLLPHLRGRTDDTIDLRVVIYRGADVGYVIRSLHDLGIDSVKRRTMDANFDVVGCTAHGSHLELIASLAGVYTVQPVASDGGNRGELANQLNTGLYVNNTIEPGYYDWLSAIGYTGADITIACVDTGIHDQAPDLANRMVECIGDSCGDESTGSSHGTLSAGAMAGDGSTGVVDPWDYLAGQGMAPRASILEQLYSPIFTEPDGMLQLMTDSWNNGAVVSSNSWGPSPTPLGYDIDTRLVDVGVRDAVPSAAGNQSLSYVVSIMNGNGGTSTQGTPDEAMNIIRVGASRLRSSGGTLQNHVDELASVSAHGPCLDGRMLPDIVAPGCYVLSTYDTFNWAYACGTSMASPQVSGAVGLFTEYYRSHVGVGRDPSPAMSKAAILLAAKALDGGEDADGYTLSHPPDSKQGWGRLAISELIDPDLEGIRYYDQSVVFGDSGEEWSIAVEPLDSSKPMRIMLAWTTAPGHGLGGSTPAWTNDLDLVVEVSGAEYAGNDIDPSSGWSNADGPPDVMNNTEAVFLGPTAPSSATIRVLASNINSDGIPGFGDGSDQDFALVCMNCKADPFTIMLDPPVIEICAPGTVECIVEVQSVTPGLSVTLNALGPMHINLELQDDVLTTPDKTALTVTVSEGASGSEEYSIVGMAGGQQVEVIGEIMIVTPFSGLPELLQPADGEIDVSTMPMLTWAMEGGTSFDLEIASDVMFTDMIYSAMATTTEHLVKTNLSYGQSYYWRVRASSACGLGDWSDTSSFTTSEGIHVLLVDDDDNTPDVQAYYTSPMNDLGLEFDVWDTMNTDNEPDLDTLRNYDLVIWFTGAEWGGFAGPGDAAEVDLAAWLDEGGVFWLSSQDYLYDRGLTPFGSSYLGVSDYDSDVGQATVTGSGSLFGGYGTMTLTCPFNNYTDSLEAAANAEVCFTGEEGVIGVNVLDETWRTVFWAFPLEAVLDDSVRRSLLLTVVNWVPVPEENTCPADVVPDGLVDVQDLLKVIAEWGGSGPEGDANDDGMVDVVDLLSIISMWGPCD
ncbi:MAG: S8 family serine peptidase [Phycisphaerales bacterium]|nr:S8 family serine peptidase [Phycisphaerales bacterium]